MKKIVSLLLALTLFAMLVPAAFAEGHIHVVSKSMIEFDGENTGYFLAKLENDGDEAIGVGTGKLVAFSADDDILLSKDFVSSSPSYIMLEPGDSVYLYDYIFEKALETSDIADYKFSMESSENGQAYTEVACESTFEIGDKSTGTASVTFTNNTDDVLNDFVIVVALTDSEGNLVFVNSNYVGIIGVHPGSTITVDMSINSDFVEYYRTHGIEPASIDAHVYY